MEEPITKATLYSVLLAIPIGMAVGYGIFCLYLKYFDKEDKDD